MESIKYYLERIEATNKAVMGQAQERLDSLVKPPKSLGKLEDIAQKLAGITGQVYGNALDKRCVVIMSADNGVVEEGVSSAPMAVTHMQSINFTKGITGVTVLADLFHSDVKVVDIGINADVNDEKIINKKIRKGTANITKGPALSLEETQKAILVGIELALSLSEAGYHVIGVGEMGIGNTTTSSALLSVLLGLEPEQVTGKGAGLSEDAYANKLAVIKKAILVNQATQEDDILTLLSKLGGLDIAGMVGLYIGCSYKRVPVVIDGFISAVAALLAYRLNPLCADYMFASHHSMEIGYKYAISEIGLEAPLNLDMRLGEGSGCPMMFMLMEASLATMTKMGTFAQGNIDEKYKEDVKNANFHIGGL